MERCEGSISSNNGLHRKGVQRLHPVLSSDILQKAQTIAKPRYFIFLRRNNVSSKKACLVIDLRDGVNIPKVADLTAVLAAAGWKVDLA